MTFEGKHLPLGAAAAVAAIVAVAQAVEDARPGPCPECADGKHGNCPEVTWDNEADRPVECPCRAAGHPRG